MKLYEINQSIQDILDCVDPENGEISDILNNALTELEMAKSEKVLSIGKYLKSIDAEAKALAEEIKNLQGRKRVLDAKYEHIKNYLIANAAGESYKDTQCVISWRKSETVSIVCLEQIDDEFFQIKREISKTLIKDAIKAGREVLGAEITVNNNIQIK